MNKKGNILIIGLIILNIICILCNIIHSNLYQVLLLKNRNINMEVLKIKTIQKIEKEFKKKYPKDFELNENNIQAIAEFNGTDYCVTISGDINYEMIISYDYVFECILDIEYYYDS